MEREALGAHMPQEILLLVVELAASHSDLARLSAQEERQARLPLLKTLSLVCRAWYELCIPEIYRVLRLKGAEVDELCQLLRGRGSVLPRYIQEVTIVGDWHRVSRSCWTLFRLLSSSATKLTLSFGGPHLRRHPSHTRIAAYSFGTIHHVTELALRGLVFPSSHDFLALLSRLVVLATVRLHGVHWERVSVSSAPPGLSNTFTRITSDGLGSSIWPLISSLTSRHAHNVKGARLPGLTARDTRRIEEILQDVMTFSGQERDKEELQLSSEVWQGLHSRATGAIQTSADWEVVPDRRPSRMEIAMLSQCPRYALYRLPPHEAGPPAPARQYGEAIGAQNRRIMVRRGNRRHARTGSIPASVELPKLRPMVFVPQAFYLYVPDPSSCQWNGPDCHRVAFNRIALDGTRELGFCVKYIYNRNDFANHPWFSGATVTKHASFLDGAHDTTPFLAQLGKEVELSLKVLCWGDRIVDQWTTHRHWRWVRRNWSDAQDTKVSRRFELAWVAARAVWDFMQTQHNARLFLEDGSEMLYDDIVLLELVQVSYKDVCIVLARLI